MASGNRQRRWRPRRTSDLPHGALQARTRLRRDLGELLDQGAHAGGQQRRTHVTDRLSEVRLIPEQPLDDQSPAALIAALPRIVRELLEASSAKLGDPDRDWLVIDARSGLESQPRTLEDVARALG